jgi:hypothetical protein
VSASFVAGLLAASKPLDCRRLGMTATACNCRRSGWPTDLERRPRQSTGPASRGSTYESEALEGRGKPVGINGASDEIGHREDVRVGVRHCHAQANNTEHG